MTFKEWWDSRIRGYGEEKDYSKYAWNSALQQRLPCGHPLACQMRDDKCGWCDDLLQKQRRVLALERVYELAKQFTYPEGMTGPWKEMREALGEEVLAYWKEPVGSVQEPAKEPK